MYGFSQRRSSRVLCQCTAPNVHVYDTDHNLRYTIETAHFYPAKILANFSLIANLIPIDLRAMVDFLRTFVDVSIALVNTIVSVRLAVIMMVLAVVAVILRHVPVVLRVVRLIDIGAAVVRGLFYVASHLGVATAVLVSIGHFEIEKACKSQLSTAVRDRGISSSDADAAHGEAGGFRERAGGGGEKHNCLHHLGPVCSHTMRLVATGPSRLGVGWSFCLSGYKEHRVLPATIALT